MLAFISLRSNSYVLTVKAEFTGTALSFHEATQHVHNEDMQCKEKQRGKDLDTLKSRRSYIIKSTDTLIRT